MKSIHEPNKITITNELANTTTAICKVIHLVFITVFIRVFISDKSHRHYYLSI